MSYRISRNDESNPGRHHGRGCKILRVWLTAWLWSWTVVAAAAVYPLPPPGEDLVGEVITVVAEAEDTLLDIARRFGLGYNEIVAANPGVDPWLPEPGTEIVVPARFVLPSVPREGIVVNLAEMRLYYFPPRQRDGSGVVMTFPLGIGQEGWATPTGVTRIVDKRRDPAWVVPESIRRASAAQGEPLPAVVPPGPDNPLGKFALRLGITSYLIHGTNKPYGVGRRISHGCLRMYPEDIEILFDEVEVGTPVRIVDHPYKVGRAEGVLYLEAHEPIQEGNAPPATNLPQVMQALAAMTPARWRERVLMRAMVVAARHRGIPETISTLDEQADSPKSGWVLQVGAFYERRNALALAGRLARQAFPVTVRARLNDGLCHVLVGPYGHRVTAVAAQAQLERHWGLEARLLPAMRHGLLAACQP